MKLNKGIVIRLLVMSLFVGVVIIAIGLGSEVTVINPVMSPLVWGTEKMEVAWQYNVAHSGNTFIGGRWLCVDEATGNALAASTKTPLISGTVHGLIIFTLIIIRWLRANKPNPNLQ